MKSQIVWLICTVKLIKHQKALRFLTTNEHERNLTKACSVELRKIHQPWCLLAQICTSPFPLYHFFLISSLQHKYIAGFIRNVGAGDLPNVWDQAFSTSRPYTYKLFSTWKNHHGRTDDKKGKTKLTGNYTLFPSKSCFFLEPDIGSKRLWWLLQH